MIFSNLNFPKKMFFLENIIFGGFPEFCCLYVFFCFYFVFIMYVRLLV